MLYRNQLSAIGPPILSSLIDSSSDLSRNLSQTYLEVTGIKPRTSWIGGAVPLSYGPSPK